MLKCPKNSKNEPKNDQKIILKINLGAHIKLE